MPQDGRYKEVGICPKCGDTLITFDIDLTNDDSTEIPSWCPTCSTEEHNQ